MLRLVVHWADYNFPRPPRAWRVERSNLLLALWYIVLAAVTLGVVAAVVVLWLYNALGS